MVANPVEFLNSIFWMWTTILSVIVSVVGFLVYRYYLEPPISRWFMSAKWKKGPVGFIQDDTNQVHLVTSKWAMPEGVIYTKHGFFLQSRAPYIPTGLFQRRKPGRPKKVIDGQTVEEVQESFNGLDDVQNESLSTVLQTPILAGLGKSVFFGYVGAPLVANLKTTAYVTNKAITVEDAVEVKGKHRVVSWFVGHSDLRVLKEIIPATISRTQLGNLYKLAETKGYLKGGGKDQMKLLYIAVAAAIPIVCCGLIVYLLIQG
jgi:hypothetical protein